MNDKLQQLYDLYLNEGLLTEATPFEVFSQADENQINSLYELGKNQGLFETTTVDVFSAAWGPVAETVTVEEGEKKNLNFSNPDNQLPEGTPSSTSISEEFNINSPSYLQKPETSTNPFTGTILSDQEVDEFQVSKNNITSDLTSDRQEEDVVAEMNYKFGDYGFQFEQTNIGDAMNVKAANGEEIKIVLDAFGIPFVNEDIGLFANKRAKKLRDFLEKNRVESERIFSERTKSQERKLKKIQNMDELKSLNTLFNSQVDNFSTDVRNFSKEQLRLDKIYQDNFVGLTPTELANSQDYAKYTQLKNNLNTEKQRLANQQKSFQVRGRELNGIAADYYLMLKKSKGDYFDVAEGIERLGSTLAEGIGGIVSGTAGDLAAFTVDKIERIRGTFDAGKSRRAADEHIDYATEILIDNTDGYALNSNLISSLMGDGDTSADKEAISNIDKYLKKGKLNVIDQDKLKSELDKLSPEMLQVVLENTVSKDGDDLHSATESIFRNTSMKAVQEYEGTEITREMPGRPNILQTETITSYDKAKSAALGDANNFNRYTGMLNNMDLESGLRDNIRTALTVISGETDEQAMTRKIVKNEGSFMQKALHGVAYSIPAFIGIYKTVAQKAIAKGGPLVVRELKKYASDKNNVSRTVRLLGQSMDAQMGKMANNPNFDNISLDEQRTVAVPVGIATAVLENIGFRNITSSSPFVQNMLVRGLNKLGVVKKGTEGKLLAKLIREDVNNLVGRGLLVIGAGGAAEFETGALQFVAEDLSERIYNFNKEKQYFQTPDSFTGYMGELLYQGALEAVGGKIMAVPTAISAMATNPKNLDLVTDEAFEMFKGMLGDTQYKKFFTTDLKQRVADPNDELTQKDADTMLETFNIIEGLMPQVPGDLNLQQQRLALSLVMERQALKTEIEPLAPELALKQNARIEEITEQLKDITLLANAEQDAAQKAESAIPEFGETKSETQELQEGDEVTTQEAEDFASAIGDETESSSTTNNLFFNRKGKPKRKLNSIKQGVRNQVLNAATKISKSITKVLPDTKIILHESSKEFNKATGTDGRGFFSFDDNIIHIDMNKANTSTVFHEVGHAFIFNTLGETNTANALKTLLTSAEKGLDSNSLLARQIKRFGQAYESQGPTVQNEERLAELFGQLAANYDTLNTPTKNAVVNFIKKIGNSIGFNFDIITEQDSKIIEMLNSLSGKVREGREVLAEDLSVLKDLRETGTENIGTPTEITKPKGGREQRNINFKDSYPNSLISSKNKIDINKLIDDIVDKKQKVWFWKADQLGINPNTGIDGGPSFALQTPGDIWASSVNPTTIQKNINNSDYIFIISGSPNVMHLFNKVVFDNITDGLPSFETFKTEALETNPVKAIRETLEKYNSFEEIRDNTDGTVRKRFLIGHQEQSKKNTKYAQYVRDNGGFIETESFIDGFFRENEFQINDIMLVLKPTGVRTDSNHSTYSNTIEGDVIGVPNKVVDAFTIMPIPIQQRAKDLGRVQQGEVISPLGSGVKSISKPIRTRGREQKSIEQIGRFFNMNDSGFMPSVINTSQIKRMLPPSVSLKRARSGSYYLSGPRGKINPFSPRGRQQKEIVDIITEGRDGNFRDEVIKDFLIRVKKFPAKVVNDLMEVSVDIFGTLPNSFRNLQDGFKSGVKLYQRAKAYEQKLIKANSKKKVKLTEQQIADQTIEFLEKQPEFKKEGDGSKSLTTRQAAMLYEFQKSVGTRPSENVQEKLTEARKLLFARKRGARDLQKIKSALRNFIRKSLPKDIYTRSEVMKLVRAVTNAQENNIENIFDEVIEFVTKKNNTRLEKTIDNILNGKYITRIGGRIKAAKVSLNIKERIEKIKKDRLNKSATAEDIDKENEALTKEFNSINQKSVKTEGDYSRMEDITLLLNINNSLQMEDTDVNKTGALDMSAKILEDMIVLGRSELKQELEESNKKYNEQSSTAIEEITGQKVDMGDPDAKSQLDLDNVKRLNARQNKTKNVIKKFINQFTSKLTQFFNEAEALDGLMDLVSKLPGEMFGGKLQELVSNRVDTSSRKYKQRMMQQEEILDQKLKEIYGKKWRNEVRSHNKLTNDPTYILDPAALEKAQKDFDDKKISAYELRQVMKENEVYLSQNEMAYYYNLYKDPANRASFEATFGKDYSRIMEEMESKMKDGVKEFADWQVNEYYPSLYPYYNEVYKSLYRTNMPWNQYYSGMIYRQGVEQESIDLLSDKSVYNTSVGASSTKFRVNNNLPIRKMNSMNVMFTYLRDMEYFAAYGETMRDINKIFSNKLVKEAISSIHGNYVNRLIDNMITKIANKGVRNSPADRVVNALNNMFIISRIGLNPTVMIKQLTSMITYANDIGYANWLKYSLKNLPQIKKTFKEISKNSVYMQDRNRQSITRVIESYSEANMAEFVPNQYWDYYVNFVMFTTKFGDKAAIYLGGMPNYLYYKDQGLKRGLSEEQAQKEAVLKFEKDTKRTQQSMDLQDRDYYQTAGALQRGLNMFMTTPKQYLRKEIQATRNLYRKVKAWDSKAGKGTLGENLRTFATYHVFAPVLFQYVTLGLPGILRGVRDEDEEDLLRAAVVGNLNALFIVGDIVKMLADEIQNKGFPVQAKSIAPLMVMQRLITLYQRFDKTKDPVKKQQHFEKFVAELTSVPGIPATQIKKFIDNMDDMGKNGDIGTDILRLLNYSKYQIEGPANKKSTTPKTTIEKNIEYQKEQKRKNKQTKKLGGYQAPKR